MVIPTFDLIIGVVKRREKPEHIEVDESRLNKGRLDDRRLDEPNLDESSLDERKLDDPRLDERRLDEGARWYLVHPTRYV